MDTVTLCLPLFLSGDGGERMFAKNYSTIAVDGCSKRCAQKAIEKYSGKTAKSIVVSELLEEWKEPKPNSRRELDEQGVRLASRVAKEIVVSMEEILAI